jgi:hypothetical protein
MGISNYFHQSHERDPDYLRHPEINYVQVGPGDYVKPPGFYNGKLKRTLEKCKKISYTFIVEPIIAESND